MITFQLRGTKQLEAKLARLGADAPRAAGAALLLEAERIMAQSKQLVPVDMGELRASGHVQLPVLTATGATVAMGYGGAGAEYALFVHEGTGPAVGKPAFMPPVDALKGWVRRNIAPPEDQLDSVTFLVARAIGRKGLKPTKFLEQPFREAQDGLRGRLAKSLDAWLKRTARAG